MRQMMMAIVAVGFVVGGCASQDNLWHQQGAQFKNWRVKSQPHAFSPSVVSHQREVCPASAADAKKPDLDACVPEVNVDGHERYEIASEGGYAGGLGPASIQAAGFVAGMYVLGTTLRPSQTNVNQNGGGASQSQGQAQAQGQVQRMLGGGGHHR